MIDNNTQDLKEELISALEKLRKKSIYRDHITVILKDLRKEDIIIPVSDEKNVIHFVLKLIETMPALLDNNPGDQALKKLCLHCIHRLNITAEIKARYSR